MAIFYQKKNTLDRKLTRVKMDVRFWTGLIFLSGFLSLFLVPFNAFVAPVPLVVTIYSVVKLANEMKTAGILRSGVEGEKRTHKIFKKLSNDYFVHSDLHVTYDGKTSQLDHVVVGPTGVFVVETKNLNGSIEADGLEKYWIQHKVGSGGGQYRNEFYSPVKQVGTHVYRFSGVLKKHGVSNWIESCVYFSNPKTSLEVTNETIPVFCHKKQGAKKIIKYIEEYETVQLDNKQIEKINSIIFDEC